MSKINKRYEYSRDLEKLPKLKPAIKRRWLKALRGGEYQQGRNALVQTDPKYGEGFCCLGVLCDLIENDKNRPGRGWNHSNINGWAFDGNTGLLTPKTRDYVFKEPTTQARLNPLIKRNDGVHFRKHSFEEIADIIEEFM